MRTERARLSFEITARDGSARAGVISTAHGPIATPAFVPLATRAAVKGFSSAEVRALGFDLLFANAYHLMLAPGAERVARLGGLHALMGWDGALITDSGGFQVFSLAHGGVADEIKGRRGRGGSHGAVLDVSEQGVRFRSYLDGSEQMLSPERSMAVQAALGSDIALAFDECTPVHVDRDYTARSTERTHRWLDRCLAWHAEHGPARQALYGIVQGGVFEDLRAESAARVVAAGVDGIAIGGTLGRDKDEMRGVVSHALGLLPAEPPRHLLGVGEPDDLIAGILDGVDTFDCAVPTRHGRHGIAIGPFPDSRYRFELDKAAHAEDGGPLVEGCPCEACNRHSRAYLHHLVKLGELTAVRLLTAHNLVYLGELTAGARAAIERGGLRAYADALAAGAAPWDATGAR